MPDTADVESAIREALRSRSDDVVLHSTELRPVPRHRRSFAPLLAAAAVLVLAIGAAFVVTQRGGDGGSQVAGGTTGFVGFRWNLVSVRDREGTVRAPDALNPQLYFTPDGYVAASDTVNGLSGRYRLTGDGYTVSDSASTLVAYAGDDPARKRVVAAVTALFYTEVGDTGEPHATVGARVDSDTLVLTTGNVDLTYRRSGVEGNQARPSSTSQPQTAGIVGYRWNVVAFSDDKGARSLDGTTPWISFPSVTSIQGDDTINGLGGTLQLTQGGFTVSNEISSAVGVGGSPELVRTVDAVDAVFSSGDTVTVSLDGHTLTLATGRVTLTLTRGDVLAPSTEAAPSATSSS